MTWLCVPGNTDAAERTLRVREIPERELFVPGLSRPHSWRQAVSKARHSLNPASCYSVVTTCGSDMNQINFFPHRYQGLSWILMTTLPVNLRESWRETQHVQGQREWCRWNRLLILLMIFWLGFDPLQIFLRPFIASDGSSTTVFRMAVEHNLIRGGLSLQQQNSH